MSGDFRYDTSGNQRRINSQSYNQRVNVYVGRDQVMSGQSVHGGYDRQTSQHVPGCNNPGCRVNHQAGCHMAGPAHVHQPPPQQQTTYNTAPPRGRPTYGGNNNYGYVDTHVPEPVRQPPPQQRRVVEQPRYDPPPPQKMPPPQEKPVERYYPPPQAAPAPAPVAHKDTARLYDDQRMDPRFYPGGATDDWDPRLTGPIKNNNKLVWCKVAAAIIVSVLMAGLSAVLLLTLEDDD